MLQYYSQPSTRLNKHGTIMQMAKSMEKDALGQHPVVETVVCRVPCGVTPQTGSLLSGRSAETAISSTTHKVIIRYRKDIKPDMWVMIDGERYDILFVLDPYLRHETLELFCEVHT